MARMKMPLLRVLLALAVLNQIKLRPNTINSDQTAPPLIKTSVKLVQVTVVATRHGSPVTDLTADDFSLPENGKSRPLSVFFANARREPVASGGSNFHLGEFTNASSATGVATILLIDRLDTPSKDWQRAEQASLRFARSLSPTDRVVVYDLDPMDGLRIIHDSRADISDLAGRIDALRQPASNHEGTSYPNTFSKRRSERETPELLSFGRLEGLSNALEAIARHVNSPGRKSLIWLASNFPDPFSPPGNSVDIQTHKMLKAINSLIIADIAIYPVDARGLIPDHSFDAENWDIGIAPVQPGQLSNSLTAINFSRLLELAHRSGGQAVFNTNGLTEAIERVKLDTSESYTLGFYTPDDPDNRFHRFSIIVKRPDIHLRYKPGFWHLAQSAQDEYSRDFDLRTTLESPFDAEAIPIEVNAQWQIVLERLRLIVFFDPSTLSTRSSADRQCRFTIDVIVGQKDRTGRVFATPPSRISGACDGAIEERKWIEIPLLVETRSQTVSLRAVIRDKASGRLGSVDIPVNAIARRK